MTMPIENPVPPAVLATRVITPAGRVLVAEERWRDGYRCPHCKGRQPRVKTYRAQTVVCPSCSSKVYLED